ncbi:MAG: hypothetical protein WCT07_00530 [Candidatus Paceibacterota bacterium]|jgi:hypothetical protein
MSKKPNGRKSQGGKSGEQNEKKVHPKKPTVVKAHGPKPDFTPRSSRVTYAEHVEQIYMQSSTLLGKLADGLIDIYGHKSDAGIIILEVKEVNLKSAIFVLESTVPGIIPNKEAFIPVSTLRFSELRQVTGDSLFAWQEKLHGFLRPLIAPFYVTMVKKSEESAKVASSNLTELDRIAIAAAEERRIKKAQDNFAQKKAKQNQEMILRHMRKSCMSVMKIVSGNIGYCDLSSSSGDLIVNFYFDGADRKVRIEYINENHMLVLTGLKINDTVFASNILQGKVDRTNMNDADFNKRSILMNHIRQQMEARGIRFIQKANA